LHRPMFDMQEKRSRVPQSDWTNFNVLKEYAPGEAGRMLRRSRSKQSTLIGRPSTDEPRKHLHQQLRLPFAHSPQNLTDQSSTTLGRGNMQWNSEPPPRMATRASWGSIGEPRVLCGGRTLSSNSPSPVRPSL
jgi:hypothetical protein